MSMDEKRMREALGNGELDLDNLTHFEFGDENTASDVVRLGKLRCLYQDKYGGDFEP